jgi:hypothetical protein
MSDTLLLILVFVISAIFGFFYIFRAYKVQTFLVRICNKHWFLGLVMGKWIVKSPYYILTLRLAGVGAWVIAAVTYFALMSRLVNRIP